MQLNWFTITLGIIALAMLLWSNIVQAKRYFLEKYNKPSININATPAGVMTPNEMRRSALVDYTTDSRPRLVGARLVRGLSLGNFIDYNGRTYHPLSSNQQIMRVSKDGAVMWDEIGQEYFKPCGLRVATGVDPCQPTWCVLPVDHTGKNHVDMEGRKKKRCG